MAEFITNHEEIYHASRLSVHAGVQRALLEMSGVTPDMSVDQALYAIHPILLTPELIESMGIDKNKYAAQTALMIEQGRLPEGSDGYLGAKVSY